MKSKPDHPSTPPSPALIQSMFNDIAPTYDFLNHFMSFGFDLRWRRKAIELLDEKRGGIFLDIATGSGDLALDALRLSPLQIVASDFAFTMLEVFREKKKKHARGTLIQLLSCNALDLPFSEDTFDVTMVAFGVRNFADRNVALREMHRVLKPEGILLILELTMPEIAVIKQLYTMYATKVLPHLGKIVSRHRSAYSYLPVSIAQFPSRAEFLAMMNAAGFRETTAIPLNLGIATLFLGTKIMHLASAHVR